ncbi:MULTISPECIES: PGPGW domain-containing protein [Agrobacterium]|uniref:PGPGW domain-containing protein n=1 Tax=Agrobacterium TaxID=357 RepID=UPI000DD2BC9E|nr:MULTISPECIES: PGPGW domain-containing protein [Agrobacterium]MDD1500297.1 PGPGW domain-containing protein [Agrobacterium sp. CNPSo 3708]
MNFGIHPKTGRLHMGKWSVAMPRSRIGRIVIGTVLVICGLLGFLPVLGFWMVPLGLLVLSQDLRFVRRKRRQLAIWWEYRKRARQARREDAEGIKRP